MRRREFLGVVGGVAAAWPLAARAQQLGRTYRIGYLRVGPPPPAWITALRQGLREHGLIEGQNIEIEFGLAQSVAELPNVAAELVRRKVDVLFASGSPTVLSARDAAGTIPVVFVGIFDFVETREVASLARPGGNLTGMSGMVVDLAGKRMQLLNELLPRITKIAILVRGASPATPPLYGRPSVPRRSWVSSCKSCAWPTPAISRCCSPAPRVREGSSALMTPCSRPIACESQSWL